MENKVFDLEQPCCPLCGQDKRETAYAWPLVVPYKVVRCQSCLLYYLSPRPVEDNILSIYQSDGYYHAEDENGYQDYQEQETSLRLTFKRFLQKLAERDLTGGSFLEVGCGFGYLLEEAAPYFSTREGTDFSEAAVLKAGQHADVTYLGGLDEIPTDRTYDFIISNQVIEHVYHPVDFLSKLANRLKPNGVMIVTTPDMGSFWRFALGSKWPSFKLPEHVLFFDHRTLSRVMTVSGLVEIEPIPFPHAFPLSLIASKLGMKLPNALGGLNAWLPKTTLALFGRKKRNA